MFEAYAEARNKKTKETLAKHDKRMIDSARASIKKYDSKPKPTNEGATGAERLTKRLKTRGVDLDKIAKDRAKEHEALKKKYATEAKEDDSSTEDNTRTGKMNQLFRMGLAKKGELSLMMRMMKRGDDALKDPKLRTKMYELLNDLVDIVTTDKQVFVKVRQNVQKNKDTDAVEEAFRLAPQQVIVTTIDVLNVNRQFDKLVESNSINTQD
jgi:hypothetical protein